VSKGKCSFSSDFFASRPLIGPLAPVFCGPLRGCSPAGAGGAPAGHTRFNCCGSCPYNKGAATGQLCFSDCRCLLERQSGARDSLVPKPRSGPYRASTNLGVQRAVLAAMAPAAAPMKNHLAARRMRRQTLPPWAICKAWSRFLVRAVVFVFSSVRSLWGGGQLGLAGLANQA
jgi:hypothetical protein